MATDSFHVELRKEIDGKLHGFTLDVFQTENNLIVLRDIMRILSDHGWKVDVYKDVMTKWNLDEV